MLADPFIIPADFLMASEFVDEMMSSTEMDILPPGFVGREKKPENFFGFRRLVIVWFFCLSFCH
jgi:hypothetical protein